MSASEPNLLKSLDYSVLQQCMHCGLCLPSCPTFAETQRERHSPRGRIALMRAVADGEIAPSKEFAEEMSYCLGCLACTSACPAGVNYAHLLETARAQTEAERWLATPKRDFIRWFTMRFLFTRPAMLRLAGRMIWFWRASGLQGLVRRSRVLRLFPKRLQELEASTPVMRRHFSKALIERNEGAVAARRYSVLVLTGCMQDIMFSEINRATVDVLRENGCDVETPPSQSCCGSLHAHNGDLETARLLAKRQLDAVTLPFYDAVISNAGGCGSHLRHYSTLLENDPEYRERAAEWDRKVKDVHEFLVEIGFRAPQASGLPDGTRVTYHESCHLSHGQKVVQQPRTILKSLPCIEFVETAEANWCCGSAGVYTLTQPETAFWLQERKVGHLQATQATIVATANPGCHLQIENGFAAKTGVRPRVAHPVVLLAEAYRAEKVLGA